MVHFLQDFEQASGQLSPLMLVGPGAVGVVLGLFVWLGGSAWRKLTLAISGFLVGAVFALAIVELAPAPAILVGLLAGGAAALAERGAVAILAAALVVVIVFCILARPFMEEPRPVKVVEKSKTVDWAQSVELMKAHASLFDEGVRRIWSQMPVHYWAILAGGAAAGALCAASFRRTAMALCFGTLGTILVFAGMILLLLQRGSTPISGIFHKSPFYAAVFGGMAAFGTCVQLIFSRQKKGASGKGKGSGENNDASSSAKKSWRTP
jgi:hypothetical protein